MSAATTPALLAALTRHKLSAAEWYVCAYLLGCPDFFEPWQRCLWGDNRYPAAQAHPKKLRLPLSRQGAQKALQALVRRGLVEWVANRGGYYRRAAFGGESLDVHGPRLVPLVILGDADETNPLTVKFRGRKQLSATPGAADLVYQVKGNARGAVDPQCNARGLRSAATPVAYGRKRGRHGK
jgi:hypothetical protein